MVEPPLRVSSRDEYIRPTSPRDANSKCLCLTCPCHWALPEDSDACGSWLCVIPLLSVPMLIYVCHTVLLLSMRIGFHCGDDATKPPLYSMRGANGVKLPNMFGVFQLAQEGIANVGRGVLETFLDNFVTKALEDLQVDVLAAMDKTFCRAVHGDAHVR